MRTDRRSKSHPAGMWWVMAAWANSVVWRDSQPLTHGYPQHVDGHTTGKSRQRMHPGWQPLHLVNLISFVPIHLLHVNMHVKAWVLVSFARFFFPSFFLFLLSPYITMWRLVDHSVPAAGSCASTRSHGHILLWLIAQCKQQQPCRDSLSQHASYLVFGSKQFPSQCPSQTLLPKQGWGNKSCIHFAKL